MTYPATQTYWLDPTDEVAIGLRRFTCGHSDGQPSSCATGYHSALVHTGTTAARWKDTDHGRVLDTQPATDRADPRWPTACAACGYSFGPDDQWQDWQELLYRRADTGELVTLRDHPGAEADVWRPAPPGACWDAWWMGDNYRGPDGIALMVRCPNGRDWTVDGRASNCTMPDDKVHKCWVRHGDPRECRVTVDKNGFTCAAGAGSIQASDYHGFLQAGVLTAG